jgi:hypothetical protein
VRQLYLKKYSLLIVVIFLCILSPFGCEKKYNTILDSTVSAPIILDHNFSLTVIDTDTITLGTKPDPEDILTIKGFASVKVEHPDGEQYIKAVRYSVISDPSSPPIGEGLLYDNGISPDQNINDSIYSGYVEFTIYRFEVGYFYVNIFCEGYTDYRGNSIIRTLRITRINRPPVISNLYAPDTVSLSRQSTFTTSLKVIDPDGQSDIKDVFRFTPSGKTPRLYAYNDSIYGETVSLTNPRPDVGSYLFRFRAFDRSKDSSNVLYKTIVVTE